MSRAYATPLELELQPSRQQRRLLLIICALCVFSILILPWPFLLQMLCVMLVALSLVLISKNAWHADRLVWQAGNHWLLVTGDMTTNARLLTESLVTRWLVILLLRTENGAKQTVLIWPDSVRPDVFRRLRVRLKIEGQAMVSEHPGKMTGRND
ncbi:MAG: hypothetical protein QG652_918 [Pseudomonadota bacterium]|nr:hypothetical protein [Pseudomonadota bacterium]